MLSKKMLLIGFVVAIAMAPNAVAQDAAAVIDASAKAMGTTTLQSIQYSGTGTNN